MDMPKAEEKEKDEKEEEKENYELKSTNGEERKKIMINEAK